MAVGKSAIGHHLAGVLNLEFVDTDQLIVAKHGPIADIFASRGEGFFRLAEARSVADVLEQTGRKPFVLSLGGGAVLDSGTQQLLARTTVVHLDADLPTVRERINRNSARPLLHGDPLERWQALAEVRTPVYRRLADVTLDVRHGSVDALVQRLIDILTATTTTATAAAATTAATTTAAAEARQGTARQPTPGEDPAVQTMPGEDAPEQRTPSHGASANKQVLQNGTT